MMLSPLGGTSGGTSFKKSKGRGIVQLSCKADLRCCGNSPVTFRIAVGRSREHVNDEVLRGPVSHDFVAQSGICGLPKEKEVWDFGRVVDAATQTFVVCLEIV